MKIYKFVALTEKVELKWDNLFLIFAGYTSIQVWEL